MAKRPKPIKRHTPIMLFCNYCNKSVSHSKVVWSWKSGPAMYCSESCKNKMENPIGEGEEKWKE